jgi:hypothetical protein
MPRFAILQHDSPSGAHWDFLLEMDGSLKTWALSSMPEVNTEIACRPLPDHRMVYLEYEGPISGDRGSVTRWDAGTFVIERESDTEIVVVLQGAKLCGQAAIHQSPGNQSEWRFSLTLA